MIDEQLRAAIQTALDMAADYARCEFNRRPRSRAGNVDFDEGYERATRSAAQAIRAIDPADVLAKTAPESRPTFDEVMAVATDDEADAMSAALARFLEARHDD